MTPRSLTIGKRAGKRWLALRSELKARFPALVSPAAPKPIDPTAIVFGRDPEGNAVHMPLHARREHTFIIGATGSGKTKLIQHCACQDIAGNRAVVICDPHGNHPDSLFRSMLQWLDRSGYARKRTVHIIDPNAGEYVTGLDPLARPTTEYEPTVMADALMDTLERLWGEEDLNDKPTLQRVLSALVTTLCALGLSLDDADLFLDPADADGFRRWAIEHVQHRDTRAELMWLNNIATDTRGHADFRLEVTGPRNRLSKLIRDDMLRLMVGGQARNLDFRAVLDEGHVVLINLAAGPRVGDKAMQMLGRLLVRQFFFATERRMRPAHTGVLYLDECQRYLSGDIPRMLAEARKFGAATVLATQTLASLREGGAGILDAIKGITNTKIVFRLKNPEEAEELADMVLQYDLELPVRSLVKPTLVGHNVVRRYNESDSEQTTIGRSRTEAFGTAETLSSSYTFSEGSGETNGSATVESSASSGFETLSYTPPESLGSGSPLISTQGLVLTSTVSGLATGAGSASGSANSNSSATTRMSSESWTEGKAETTSASVAFGTSERLSRGKSRGWQESLEPVLEDRPTSVYSLEAMRHMGARLLRNLTTGNAVFGLVDKEGVRSVPVRIANVPDPKIKDDAAVAAIRRQMWERSPSATPLHEARAYLEERRTELRQLVQGEMKSEPETPAGFRNKRKRVAVVEPSVEVHGERSAPDRAPVKGRDRLRRRP